MRDQGISEITENQKARKLLNRKYIFRGFWFRDFRDFNWTLYWYWKTNMENIRMIFHRDKV